VRARGFTLVEVMVALAIVAIALPAVLVSLYRQIDDTAYLRDKTMAEMVAANKLAEMRLVIASTRVLTAGKDNGVTPMADREWHWWVETKPIDVSKMFRTEIRVGLSEEQQAQPLYTLMAFMSSDLQIEDPTSPLGPGEEDVEGQQLDGGSTTSDTGVDQGSPQEGLEGLPEGLPEGLVPDG